MWGDKKSHLRSRNNEVPTTQFISTPDSRGKPLSAAKSLERIAGKGFRRNYKRECYVLINVIPEIFTFFNHLNISRSTLELFDFIE
jgi:hypothetical protein